MLSSTLTFNMYMILSDQTFLSRHEGAPKIQSSVFILDVDDCLYILNSGRGQQEVQ